MKRVFLWALIAFLIQVPAQAQTRATRQKSGKEKKAGSSSIRELTSAASYPAKGATPAPYRFSVTDPILTTLDARSRGANIPFNKSGIIGMPKRAYGFANGHISLKTTGAVTSGTQTGSGAVASGTSLGTFGSTGPAMEVNGKSPDAGSIMWGNARNLYLPRLDSLARTAPMKKH